MEVKVGGDSDQQILMSPVSLPYSEQGTYESQTFQQKSGEKSKCATKQHASRGYDITSNVSKVSKELTLRKNEKTTESSWSHLPKRQEGILSRQPSHLDVNMDDLVIVRQTNDGTHFNVNLRAPVAPTVDTNMSNDVNQKQTVMIKNKFEQKRLVVLEKSK